MIILETYFIVYFDFPVTGKHLARVV